jgi:hypothetical protein
MSTNEWILAASLVSTFLVGICLETKKEPLGAAWRVIDLAASAVMVGSWIAAVVVAGLGFTLVVAAVSVVVSGNIGWVVGRKIAGKPIFG